MSRLQMLISSIIVCFGLLYPPQMLLAIEEETERSGEMRLKLERIRESEYETKENEKGIKKTELEKNTPYLFTEKTKEEMTTKQKEVEKEIEDWKNTLFIQKKNEITKVKAIEETLFLNDYKGEVITNSEYVQKKESINESNGKPMLISLIGIVLISCIGLYALIRKMFE